MKHLRKFILTICLLQPFFTVMGQTGQELPSQVFHWRCANGDSLLNFHPATTDSFSFDSIPWAEDFTIIVVYKPVTDAEATVWRLVYADSIVRSLTTERIFSDSIAIRYADTTESRPVIHTLSQSAPGSETTDVSLEVGDGNIEVVEVLYYDHRLGNAALRRVQSVLAIRYGITLGPVDYIGGGGRVWNHSLDSSLFHHRITGICNDTAISLCQLCSRSEMGDGTVTLSADSLPQGAYLLFGDNDAPMTFQDEDGGIEVLARRWRVQSTGAEGVFFSLAFDTRGIPMPTDSLVLVMDGSIVLPSATTANEVRFSGLWLPSDSCTFTLARGFLLRQMAQSGTKGSRGHTGNDMSENGFSMSCPQFSIYPNPTTGHFHIEVSGAGQVRVTIYSLQGKEVATYSDSGHDHYCFEGTLPSGNIYYATIATEGGSQTLKLVVE